MIYFIREINGFYNKSVQYGDTNSFEIEKKNWEVLDKAKLVGEELCPGNDDSESGGIFHGLLLAPKMKYC